MLRRNMASNPENPLSAILMIAETLFLKPQILIIAETLNPGYY